MTENDPDKRLSQAEQIAQFKQALPADVTARFEAAAAPEPQAFFLYLARLYTSLDAPAQRRLIADDMDRATAYLWAAKKLQNHAAPDADGKMKNISVRLATQKPDGTRTPIMLHDLFDAIEPHLPLLKKEFLPPVVDTVLGEAIRQDDRKIDDALAAIRASLEKTMIDGQEINILLETDRLKLVRLGSYRAARHFANGMQTCTSKSETAFNNYDRVASLFLMMDKADGKKYQFHFGPLDPEEDKFELTDGKDMPVSLAALLKRNDLSPDNWTATLLSNVLADVGQRRYKPAVPDLLVRHVAKAGRMAEVAAPFIQDPAPEAQRMVARILLPYVHIMPPAAQDECLGLGYDLFFNGDDYARLENGENFLCSKRRLKGDQLDLWWTYKHKLESCDSKPGWRPEPLTEFQLELKNHPFMIAHQRPKKWAKPGGFQVG